MSYSNGIRNSWQHFLPESLLVIILIILNVKERPFPIGDKVNSHRVAKFSKFNIKICELKLCLIGICSQKANISAHQIHVSVHRSHQKNVWVLLLQNTSYHKCYMYIPDLAVQVQSTLPTDTFDSPTWVLMSDKRIVTTYSTHIPCSWSAMRSNEGLNPHQQTLPNPSMFEGRNRLN